METEVWLQQPTRAARILWDVSSLREVQGPVEGLIASKDRHGHRAPRQGWSHAPGYSKVKDTVLHVLNVHAQGCLTDKKTLPHKTLQ